MRRTTFSKADDAVLIANWHKRRKSELAMMMLRYPAAVELRASTLGLGRQPDEVFDRSARHNSDYIVYDEKVVRAASGRKGFHYSNKCDQFISENWETMHYSEIAKQLKRKPISVYSRARNTLLLPSQVKK